MDLLVSRVLKVLIKRLQLAFHSLEINVTHIFVLKQIDDNFIDLGRYLTLIIDFCDEILTLFFEPLLIIFQLLEFSLSLNKEKVFFVASLKDIMVEPDAFGIFFGFVKAVYVELKIG